MGEFDSACLPSFEEVPGASGGALFLRASIFSQGIHFCEAFGMYYEDVDFCLRLRQKGYTFYSVNTAIAYHVFSGVLKQNGSAKKYYFTERNCYWVVLRNFPFPGVLKSYLFSVPVTLAMVCGNAVKGHFPQSCFGLAGIVIGLLSLAVYFPWLFVKGFSSSRRKVFKAFVDQDRILPPRLEIDRDS